MIHVHRATFCVKKYIFVVVVSPFLFILDSVCSSIVHRFCVHVQQMFFENHERKTSTEVKSCMRS